MTSQAKAYRAVRTALAKGELRRASFCSRCGKPDYPASDGRSTIQAHHLSGYDHPLLVEWLCAECHRAETPLPTIIGAPVFGQANGQAKLTVEIVRQIRTSPLGCVRLGRLFGVDKKTIQRVRNGTHWLAAAPQPLSPGEVKYQMWHDTGYLMSIIDAAIEDGFDPDEDGPLLDEIRAELKAEALITKGAGHE